MALHDFSNPIIVASIRLCFSRTASFIRSKINIFASIARPIESIIPAIDASVSTIPNDLTIAVKIKAYITSAIPAMSHDTR